MVSVAVEVISIGPETTTEVVGVVTTDLEKTEAATIGLGRTETTEVPTGVPMEAEMRDPRGETRRIDMITGEMRGGMIRGITGTRTEGMRGEMIEGGMTIGEMTGPEMTEEGIDLPPD